MFSVALTCSENMAFLLTVVFISIGFLVIIFFIELTSKYRDNLHDKYHEGYNQAKDDKVKYYSTINSLRDDFDKIISNFKIDNLKPSIITTDMLLKYRESLNEYYDN